MSTAARELGITPDAVRFAMNRGLIAFEQIDGRTRMIPRAAVDAYRRDHLGQRGRRKKPAEPAE